MQFIQNLKRKKRLSAQRRARQDAQIATSWDKMFSSLDDETRQETALRYLRDIDDRSLRKLYEAVDLYRKADKILRDKVKDPEPEPSEPNTVIEPELSPINEGSQNDN